MPEAVDQAWHANVNVIVTELRELRLAVAALDHRGILPVVNLSAQNFGKHSRPHRWFGGCSVT
jgi:hypothetical protein